MSLSPSLSLSPPPHTHTYLEALEVAHPTDLVPGLVGEPVGGGVCQLVLQPHPPSQQEHELSVVHVVLGPARNDGERIDLDFLDTTIASSS